MRNFYKNSLRKFRIIINFVETIGNSCKHWNTNVIKKREDFGKIMKELKKSERCVGCSIKKEIFLSTSGNSGNCK